MNEINHIHLDMPPSGKIEDLPQVVQDDIRHCVVAYLRGGANLGDGGWDMDRFCKTIIQGDDVMFLKMIKHNGDVKVAAFHLKQEWVDSWMEEDMGA